MVKRKAVIIGAGPAGLTAAYELLKRTDVEPVVLEKSDYMGGISRTVRYKGNRIDIGGHRFFSKVDRVMNWWLEILPIECDAADAAQQISYQGKKRTLQAAGTGPDPKVTDEVMLVRQRKSRIFFSRQFFDYPIRLSVETLTKLGLMKTVKIGISYVYAMLFPIKKESNLEEFFINRFGRELYNTFFKSYTEKVWGIACSEISAEWGAQRIKGLSILKTITHILKKQFGSKPTGLSQKDTETSLIERFMYPKLGPGQMWEEVARRVQEQGSQVHTYMDVQKIHASGNRVVAVEAVDSRTAVATRYEGDFFFSTMPIQELMRALDPPPPAEIRAISDGLIYRDFITVGLLLDDLKIKDTSSGPGKKLIEDNWIYVQEPDVLVGRLQIFNNWSPYLVADPTKVWIGLEYFCFETDEFWKKTDAEILEIGKAEMVKLGIIEASKVLDGCVIRMPKTYPAYFGAYERFPQLREWIQGYENLFLVGRNGMHKYNNQDHSMLTAMTAVDNIAAGRTDQSNIWAVNTEQEYHEEKEK